MGQLVVKEDVGAERSQDLRLLDTAQEVRLVNANTP
jgi:hypothetical protein